ncbi:MAG TPA: TIGR02678 family protein [Clostridiales bacterium]|nr:TIGR02678 family protein [Clostridiales bacterium]
MADVTEERAMALQDLLDRILVTRADQPDAYRRVHLHLRYLRTWFMDGPGWRLLAGPGSYRLERLPSQVLPERGLPRLRAPLDYACLCWILWFAETRSASLEEWFLLSGLAAEVTRAGDGLFSLGERGHRESLVRALQFLEDLGILSHRDGDTGQWVGQEGEADVLYDFAPDAPRLLANFDYAGLDRLREPPPDRATLPWTGETAAPRNRAWRALLLGPAFWRADDPGAFAVLTTEEERFRFDLDEPLGWDLEVGTDHARIWRTAAARTAGSVLLDLLESGGERHVKFIFHPILLLLAVVREWLAAGRLAVEAGGTVAVGAGDLVDALWELRQRHRRDWGVELGEQMGSDQLARQVFRQMREMGYLRGPDPLCRCFLLPAAALMVGQYVAAAPGRASAQPEGEQAELFGEEAER